MSPDDFDWQAGEILHWDLTPVDAQLPLRDQLEHLKEDLAQVRYPSCVVLDIGWYPECSDSGVFQVMVVRDENWDAPLFQKAASTPAQLRETLREGIAVAANARQR